MVSWYQVTLVVKETLWAEVPRVTPDFVVVVQMPNVDEDLKEQCKNVYFGISIEEYEFILKCLNGDKWQLFYEYNESNACSYTGVFFHQMTVELDILVAQSWNAKQNRG